MELSVIIPCYNREDTIRGAVLSVLNQLGEHSVEVIVVDDGSTDSSIEKISDLNVKIFKTQGRTGACNARNLGVQNARHDIIAFNDSDDYWVINKLEQLEKVFTQYNIDYLFHSFIRVKGNQSNLGGGYLQQSSLIDKNQLSKKILTDNQISTQCLVIKKNILDQIGGFDIDLGRFQDWELALRICNYYKGYYIAKPLALCIESTDSISKSKLKGIIARRYILKKHLSLFKKHPAQLLIFRLQLFIRTLFSMIFDRK